jgi:hypothetical protein
MAQAVSFWCLTEEARVWFEVSPSGKCGGQCGSMPGIFSMLHYTCILSIVQAKGLRMPCFKSTSMHLGFVLPLGYLHIPELLFHSVSFTAPKLHTHLHLMLHLLEQRTIKLGGLPKSVLLEVGGCEHKSIIINISGLNTWLTDYWWKGIGLMRKA